MAFVTKVVFLLFATSLFAQTGQLDDLWKQNKWKEWINEASSIGLKSPEAHFNLASSSWESEDSAEAVKNLFLSSQLRSNPFKAWSDLTWISQIQSILFAQPSPIDSYRLRLFLIWTQHLQIIWICSLVWILLIAVFFQWGTPKLNHWNRVLLFIFFLNITLGSLLFLNKRGLSHPAFLARAEKLVPVFKDSDSKNEEPLLELPPGVVVLTGEIKNGRISIQEPIKAWVDQNKIELYPVIN